jgi:SAM-dependent methyltransferase
MSGGKAHAPAAARNREPIAEVLKTVLPPSGIVIEIASGTGQHVAHFARLFPQLLWQPTDRDCEAVESIAAWREEAKLANLLPPLRLDAQSADWPVAAADAILCINMVHISPWEATVGLMRGAGRLLAPGAPLILYGAYIRDEVPTAPSNLAFDESLRRRNPSWGLRTLEAVSAEAEKNGFAFEQLFEMPANNLTVVFRKR